MTQALIVELAALQGTVMSQSTVQRILATAEVQPHRERYYLFTPKDRPDYIPRRDAICDLYMSNLPDDEVIVCFDEKSNIQALGSPYPGRPTAPGRVRRVEHNYIRHGTRNLVASVRPDTGEVVAAEVFPSRGFATAEAVAMLETVAQALPGRRRIHLVWDNGSTHISREMKDFLSSEAGARFWVYYTPAHASWLNLAENFFSRFTTRYLAGRRHDALVDLDDHLYASLDDYGAATRSLCRGPTIPAWPHRRRFMANEARYFGESVLRKLHEDSELARRWLRARPRGKTCTLGLEEEDEWTPLLRLANGSGAFNVMDLQVRNKKTWAYTGVRGIPDVVAKELLESLRFTWEFPAQAAETWQRTSDQPH